MLIKFEAPDPRAGTTVQMDSSRGQFFIDNGSAVQVKEGAGAETQPNPEGGGDPAAKASEGLTVAQLKAALDAKGTAYPDHAKKPELAALLDGEAVQ